MRLESTTNYLSEPHRASNNSETGKETKTHSFRWLSTKMQKATTRLQTKEI